MPRKTNKTSHVLNLITNGSAPEPEEAADGKQEAPVTDTAAGGTPGEGVSGKETPDRGAPDRGEPDRGAPDRGAPDRGASDRGAPGQETARESEPLKEPVSRITASGDKTVIVVNETSQNDNISSKILNRLTDQLEEEIQGKLDHYHMVNVMEQILRRMELKHYMAQYDVCMCSRCQADVMALILTRLPAKYVVVDESSTAPIIGFYESKFKVRILTEIIKACIDVKEYPRHDRSGPYDRM